MARGTPKCLGASLEKTKKKKKKKTILVFFSFLCEFHALSVKAVSGFLAVPEHCLLTVGSGGRDDDFWSPAVNSLVGQGTKSSPGDSQGALAVVRTVGLGSCVHREWLPSFMLSFSPPCPPPLPSFGWPKILTDILISAAGDTTS